MADDGDNCAAPEHDALQATRDAAWKEIEGIRAEIEGSPGWFLRGDLASLARSQRIFAGNTSELHGLLRRSASPDVWLSAWDREHPERLEQLLDEADRLFHNFLAAAFSLISHTIAFRNRHVADDSALAADYTQRNPTPRSPLCLFMKRLRIIAQHERLPISQGNVSAWRDDTGQLVVEPSLVLDRTTLMSRHEWTGQARKYLKALDADPSLEKLSTDYSLILRGFADWFAFRFVQEHLAEFRVLESLYQRLGPATALFREPRT